MKTCSLCSAELKFLTSVAFGLGKLNDGGEICISCSSKVGNSVVLKKHSLEDVKKIIEDKLNNRSEKQIKADEKKALAEEQKKLKFEQKTAEFKAHMEEREAEAAPRKKRLEEIKTTIQDLKLDNMSSFFGRKEINELPDILAADEQIDNIIQGMYNNGQGILVSTNRRLVFVDKGLLYGIKVEDFPLDKLTSIQYETGLLFGKVKLHTSGNIASIEQVDKSAARKFAEFVRDKLSQPKQQAPVQPAAAAQPGILEQIEKLAQLKEKGILSEEEFTEQKKKLLEKL
jgi:hypothetical protein